MALDLLASGKHSCECPFGPPASHQRSRPGPNGQPPEVHSQAAQQRCHDCSLNRRITCNDTRQRRPEPARRAPEDRALAVHRRHSCSRNRVFLESKSARASARVHFHCLRAGPRRLCLWCAACLDLVRCLQCNCICDENLGAATGFPFGVYHFEVGADLPHVGLIPIIVGPLWFGAGYFSWTVASVLLDGADRKLDDPFNLVSLPVVAAFVMTQWDLVMDAPNATIAKVWIWHDGGGVFGVPLSNYLGWLLTSWLIFQTFALYLRRSGLPPYPRMSLKLAVTGILFYVGSGLTHIVPWIMGQTGEAVDGRGYGWQVHDIRESTVAILLLTMVFTALLAALRLLRQASSNSGPTASSQDSAA